jgi:Alw26I/Eco31I/Esp3I family type II restriction endonuclease
MASKKEYGSKGQKWHPEFVSYVESIAHHPNYSGMPDAFASEEKIQWEAPSNRGSGKFKETHHKRRKWWTNKALAIGINPNSDQWISRTAKAIHPTGIKPCRRCGGNLRLAYAYFSSNLSKKAVKLFGANMAPKPLEEIGSYIKRVHSIQGTAALSKLPEFLKTGTIKPPDLGRNLSKWLSWLEESYIPLEPSTLSPGAMSNAPDRFDGFHHFNRCCRNKADTGRHASNLSTYTTDRRVFEYWSEGDWIAADRMMGLIGSEFATYATADGGPGLATADHIGPLSLGFTHRPEFRLLSKSANSAKNNRMTLWDINYLQAREREGIQVVSWHARSIWDLIKRRAVTEEKCLRVSKMMRDNQRYLMTILGKLFQDRQLAFLVSLLELERANFSVKFEGTYVDYYVVRYQKEVHTPRTTKYSSTQMAMRLRIGFTALEEYTKKTNRHQFGLTSPEMEYSYNELLFVLNKSSKKMRAFNRELIKDISLHKTSFVESSLRKMVATWQKLAPEKAFTVARAHLDNIMTVVAKEIAEKWNDDRYVRTDISIDD